MVVSETLWNWYSIELIASKASHRTARLGWGSRRQTPSRLQNSQFYIIFALLSIFKKLRNFKNFISKSPPKRPLAAFHVNFYLRCTFVWCYRNSEPSLPPVSDKDQEEKAQRCKFVQGLLWSTILDDGLWMEWKKLTAPVLIFLQEKLSATVLYSSVLLIY